jgi:hypothetical protein
VGEGARPLDDGGDFFPLMSITPAAIRDPTITEAHPRMMRIITSGFITINMLYYFGMYAFPLRTALAYTAHKQK